MPSGPLSDVKVFDMTTAGVGPFASMQLALLGADVLKIEPPHGDIALHVPPNQHGLSCMYTAANLSKRSIALDLGEADDRALAYRIIANADVLVENARSDAAVEAMGMGYGKLSELNPQLIYASCRAWGHRGPMKDVGGNASTVEAFSGCTAVTGAVGGKPEFTRLAGLIDLNTSCFLAASVLQALVWRQRTGRGAHVRTSMLAAALSAQTTRIAEYLATRRVPQRWGSATTTTVPHEMFECQDRTWIAVGVENDVQWRKFCEALESDSLRDDLRFATNPDRVLHREQLIPLLQAEFLRKPAVWWSLRFKKTGVAYGRELDFETLRDHEHVVVNQYIVPVTSPHQGDMWVGGLPWKFARTPGQLSPAPFPGQHTDEIRHEYGLSGAGNAD